jgi:hypothetical protein
MKALVEASEAAGYGRRPVSSLIWEKAELVMTKDGMPTPESLFKFLNDHKRSLNVLWGDAAGKEQAMRLRRIYDALEITSRVGMPKGTVSPYGAADKLREATGISVPQVASRFYALNAGLIGKRHAVFESAMRFFGTFTGRRAKALMKEALYDPNIARDIDMIITSPASAAQDRLNSLPVQRLNAALFKMGIETVQEENK